MIYIISLINMYAQFFLFKICTHVFYLESPKYLPFAERLDNVSHEVLLDYQ